MWHTCHVSSVLIVCRLVVCPLPLQTAVIYANVCRGLFEKDKMLFAFLISAGIQREAGSISPAEWSLFLVGSSILGPRDDSGPKNPWPERITPTQWDLAVAAQVRLLERA